MRNENCAITSFGWRKRNEYLHHGKLTFKLFQKSFLSLLQENLLLLNWPVFVFKHVTLDNPDPHDFTSRNYYGITKKCEIQRSKCTFFSSQKSAQNAIALSTIAALDKSKDIMRMMHSIRMSIDILYFGPIFEEH